MALDGVSFHATLSKFPLAGQKQQCLSQIWEAQRYSFKQEDSMHACMLACFLRCISMPFPHVWMPQTSHAMMPQMLPETLHA